MLPTPEDIDEYVSTLNEYIHSLPGHAQAVYQRIISDIQRHGPSAWPSTVTVPGLGTFDIPVPSPPISAVAPPLEKTPWYRLGFIDDEATRRRVAIAGGVLGVGLGAGYGAWLFWTLKDQKRAGVRRRKESNEKLKVRKEVVGTLSMISLDSKLNLGPSRSRWRYTYRTCLGACTGEERLRCNRQRLYP